MGCSAACSPTGPPAADAATRTSRTAIEEPCAPQLEQWEKFCAELGHAPADVALAWLLANPIVTAPIIGPRTVEQVDGAMGALDVRARRRRAGPARRDLPRPGRSRARSVRMVGAVTPWGDRRRRARARRHAARRARRRRRGRLPRRAVRRRARAHGLPGRTRWSRRRARRCRRSSTKRSKRPVVATRGSATPWASACAGRRSSPAGRASSRSASCGRSSPPRRSGASCSANPARAPTSPASRPARCATATSGS